MEKIKYIFHGGGARIESDSNTDFYRELVKDVPEDGTVLFVYFASRGDDYNERLMHDREQCIKVSEGKNLSFLVATEEVFIEQVAKADAIYLRGGSTQKLLDSLKGYPNLRKHFEGKIVAGSSAGAYVLSTFYSSHYEDVASEGLAIVPVGVVTHFQSEKMPPKAGAVEALKNTAQDLRLIILREGEWEVVLL